LASLLIVVTVVVELSMDVSMADIEYFSRRAGHARLARRVAKTRHRPSDEESAASQWRHPLAKCQQPAQYAEREDDGLGVVEYTVQYCLTRE